MVRGVPSTQSQVRCAECNRRLADYVNEVAAGQLILELKCPKCGRPPGEVIRRRTSLTGSTDESAR
jgi:phage FluMu protein Com